MHNCLACAENKVDILVELGKQPPSNRFESADAIETDEHDLTLGKCAQCGLLQLIDPMHPSLVRPNFDWIYYNEPEQHLDDLVTKIVALPEITPLSRVMSMSYKDHTTLDRLNRLGFQNVTRLDHRNDLGIIDPRAGLETFQSVINPHNSDRIRQKYGPSDILFVRHMLEHAHSPQQFIAGAARLMRPGAYIVVEVPDCEKFVRHCDYSFIWEEHVTYFSEATLVKFMEDAGFEVSKIFRYAYPLEDSLVCVSRLLPLRPQRPSGNIRKCVDSEIEAERFKIEFDSTRSRIQQYLRKLKSRGSPAVIFGAGHLSAKFINLYGVGGLVHRVIDDNPNKQKLLMPGSRIPIVGSTLLNDESITTCLLALNPESEQKIVCMNEPFLRKGGRFLSIFAAHSKSIYNEAS
jgi:hypothetical protein